MDGPRAGRLVAGAPADGQATTRPPGRQYVYAESPLLVAWSLVCAIASAAGGIPLLVPLSQDRKEHAVCALSIGEAGDRRGPAAHFSEGALDAVCCSHRALIGNRKTKERDDLLDESPNVLLEFSATFRRRFSVGFSHNRQPVSLHGRKIVECRVDPLVVVVLDVAAHLRLELLQGLPFP